MIDEDKWKAWFQRVVDTSGRELRKSEIYLALFTDGFEREPQCALELGIAVLLDKPLYVVAPVDKVIPRNIIRLALKIERYDPRLGPAGLEVATARLCDHWRARFGAGVEAPRQ